jgi:thiosulfate/3-mercaptopyruvate sulfurtransferase
MHRRVSKARMTKAFESLVSTEWLADRLGTPGLAVLDASKHLPVAGRDPRADFEAGHIPGARFLDLATLSDKTSSVPAALPRPEQVARRLADLGAAPGAHFVLYDDSAIRSSARAWFTLTQCGVRNVSVLDGGFAKWRDEGRALESDFSHISPLDPAAMSELSNVAFKHELLANIETGFEQLLDARAPDRVFGAGIDPVHGGQNGRIPGSLNLPFSEVFARDGTYRSADELRALFASAGVDFERPLMTTCGSGMTASVLLFAAHLAGKDDVRLYDGSWQEWEADPRTPKEQGPA